MQRDPTVGRKAAELLFAGHGGERGASAPFLVIVIVIVRIMDLSKEIL